MQNTTVASCVANGLLFSRHLHRKHRDSRRHPPQAQQALIQIPRNALLNHSTISHLYPNDLVERVSANQLLCLHLCLYRSLSLSLSSDVLDVAGGQESRGAEQEVFLPFIASLPQDFRTVPLWSQVDPDTSVWEQLSRSHLLPEGLRRKTEDVQRRFETDYRATVKHWVRNAKDLSLMVIIVGAAAPPCTPENRIHLTGLLSHLSEPSWSSQHAAPQQ